MKFNDLYKKYQTAMLNTFHLKAKKNGWTIAKKVHKNKYSRDLTQMELHLKHTLSDETLIVAFENIWLDFVYVDREADHRSVDPNFFSFENGLKKIHYLVDTRLDIAEAVITNDKDMLCKLSRNSRVRIFDKKNNEVFHSEDGQLIVGEKKENKHGKK